MLRTPIFALMLALVSIQAQAQLAVSAGIEYLKWEEETTPAVTETGPLLALGLEYTWDQPEGFVFRYRGRFYTGDVAYDGAFLFSGTPVKSTTSYLGIDNEIQARYRKPIEDEYWLDLVLGLGWDSWQRKLSASQKEDFDVAYARLGAEFDTHATASWLIGFGVKYPLWIREDAHLTDIGFDSNPQLKPGRDISFYGRLGYHIDRNLRLIAYADGFRFKQSAGVDVNEVALGLGPTVLVQPRSKLFIGGVKLEYAFQ